MTTLAGYLERTYRLLDDFQITRFNPFDLTRYINEARRVVAAEGECVRVLGNLATAAGVESYDFSAITGYPASVASVISVWQLIYQAASPPLLLESRSWPWFNLYWRTLGQVASGPPQAWALFQPGEAGLIFIGPLPNAGYQLAVDMTGQPIPLALNSDPDAIPYPWDDAVAFYAAYLAAKQAQMDNAAQQNYQLYEQYMARARAVVTPQILPGNFPGNWRARGGLPAMSATVQRDESNGARR